MFERVAAPVTSEQEPALTGVFTTLGVLEMLGGLGLCVALWPGTPEAGHPWNALAYVPALTWLMSGLVFGFLFLAVGEVLLYLCHIRTHLRLLSAAAGAFVPADRAERAAPPNPPPASPASAVVSADKPA